jgi:hypothetical protein
VEYSNLKGFSTIPSAPNPSIRNNLFLAGFKACRRRAYFWNDAVLLGERFVSRSGGVSREFVRQILTLTSRPSCTTPRREKFVWPFRNSLRAKCTQRNFGFGSKTFAASSTGAAVKLHCHEKNAYLRTAQKIGASSSTHPPSVTSFQLSCASHARAATAARQKTELGNSSAKC